MANEVNAKCCWINLRFLDSFSIAQITLGHNAHVLIVSAIKSTNGLGTFVNKDALCLKESSPRSEQSSSLIAQWRACRSSISGVCVDWLRRGWHRRRSMFSPLICYYASVTCVTFNGNFLSLLDILKQVRNRNGLGENSWNKQFWNTKIYLLK
jgi:hypothetical protein